MQSNQEWICRKCSFKNIHLLNICQMCENQNNSEKINQDKNIHIQEVAIQCIKCKQITRQPSQQCIYCGHQFNPKKKSINHDKYQMYQKQQFIIDPLIKCPHCSMENHSLNINCLFCDNQLKLKLPIKEKEQKTIQKLTKTKIKDKNICQHCGDTIQQRHLKTHLKSCSKQINKQQIQENISNKLSCPFCWEKIERKDQQKHGSQCKQKKQFYQNNKSFERMTQLQINTIKYMHQKSQKYHNHAYPFLLTRVRKLGYKEEDLDNLHHYIINYAPIIIHVRVNAHMQFFVKDTHYRNQFEVRKSASGARVQWQDRMFDKKHHKATPFQRVKYGTINFTNDPKGVKHCSGYGASYFLLKEHVRDRCTFTDMDSAATRATIGTFRFCFHVLNKLSDCQLKAAIKGSQANQIDSGNTLKYYKQIQIHGPVQFNVDIQRVYGNKIQLADPKTIIMLKQFCSNNKIQSQIFEYDAYKIKNKLL